MPEVPFCPAGRSSSSEEFSSKASLYLKVILSAKEEAKLDPVSLTISVTCSHCKKEHKKILVPQRITKHILEDQVPPEPLSIHCGEDHDIKVFLARGILADGRALIRHSYVELLENAAQRDDTREDTPHGRELDQNDSKQTGTKVENLTEEFFSDLLEAKGETLPIQKVDGNSTDSTVLELLEDTHSNAKQKAQHLFKIFESKNPQKFKSIENRKSNAVEEVRDLIRFFYRQITLLTQRTDLSKRNQHRIALFHVAIALQSFLGQKTASQLLKRALEPTN